MQWIGEIKAHLVRSVWPIITPYPPAAEAGVGGLSRLMRRILAASHEIRMASQERISTKLAYEDYPILEDVWMEPEAILDRVWLHLNELVVNPNTVLYFYGALELRFFIESVFFTITKKLREETLTRKDKKLYRPKDFDRILTQLDSNYMIVAAEEIGWDLEPSIVEEMNELYGRLGNILHLPKTPLIQSDQNDWKLDVEQLVIDSFEFLRRIVGYKYPGEI